MSVPLLRVCYRCGYPTPGRHASSCPDADSGVVVVAKHTAPVEIAALRAQVASLTAERDRLRTERDDAEEVGALSEAGRMDARAERDALAAERVLEDRVIEAARALVALKDGPRDDAYYRDRDAAWQTARAAVDALDGAAGPSEDGSDG